MEASFSLLLWFCVALGLFGLGVMTIGIIVQVLYFNATNLIESNVLAAPTFLIVVGAVIFIVAFMGCCGALKKSFYMLMTFGTFVMVLFLAGFAAGVASYLNHSGLESIVADNLNSTMLQYPNDEKIQKSWNVMQHELQCCGINGPSDWSHIGNGSIPSSCCNEIPFDANTNTYQCVDAYLTGCLQLVVETISNKATILGIVASSISFVLIIIVIFTCYLAGSIRREYETV